MPPSVSGTTIAAQATPPGNGALAVVRLSGDDALPIAERVFRGALRPADLSGYQGAHGWIWGPRGPLDEVVLWVYRSPRSYTGEDMLEISCHGGLVSARRVVDALYREGARPAEPGEFTRRAFLNGKIDLAQAEAVAALIAARGRRAQEQALLHLQGGLSSRVGEAAAIVRAALAEIEGHLDFGDDVPRPPEPERLARALADAHAGVTRLVASHAATRAWSDGWVVVFAGRPNVGKSSLLNALLGHDRALVHESPGTTRDVVDAWVEWDGVPVRLLDTAGLRDPAEPVEEAGIARARREAAAADLVLWVVDASRPPDADDRALAASFDPLRLRLVLNKMDLGSPARDAWSAVAADAPAHATSALTGAGVEDLVRTLSRDLGKDMLDGEGVVVTSERHALLLEEGATALRRSQDALAAGLPLELVAADLHHALESLGSITGDRASADVLDEIFRRFCIGK